MSDLSNDFLIEDTTILAHQLMLADKGRGLVERQTRVGSYGGSEEFSGNVPLIPENEWSDRIKEMETDKTRLSDVRMTANAGNPMDALDQGQEGACWCYSVSACMMLLRAVANMPHKRLSPHAVMCELMDYRDRGGWAALCMDFATKRGIPDQNVWPPRSMSRANDTPEVWTNAKRYKVTEGWIDVDINHPADADMTFKQVASLLLHRIPVACDFMWWGHSVCAMDLVETAPGKFGLRILNSWGNDWGEFGTGVLIGSKARPDGACAPRVVMGA